MKTSLRAAASLSQSSLFNWISRENVCDLCTLTAFVWITVSSWKYAWNCLLVASCVRIQFHRWGAANVNRAINSLKLNREIVIRWVLFLFRFNLFGFVLIAAIAVCACECARTHWSRKIRVYIFNVCLIFISIRLFLCVALASHISAPTFTIWYHGAHMASASARTRTFLASQMRDEDCTNEWIEWCIVSPCPMSRYRMANCIEIWDNHSRVRACVCACVWARGEQPTPESQSNNDNK